MAELRQRKLSEPHNGIPTSVDARSADPAAKRRKTKPERDLLLFATPLIIFLHIALVCSKTSYVVVANFSLFDLCLM